MTLFFLLASLLVIASLSILLPLMTGQRIGNDLDHQDANLAIARERQTALRQAFDAGEIDEETYRAESDSLEEALAADLASGQHQRRDTRGQWFAIATVVIAVPISAGVLYMQLGTPEAMNERYVADVTRQAQAQVAAQAAAEGVAGGGSGTDSGAGDEQRQAALDELIPQLEQRLAEAPDDLQGWRLLGRTRLMSGAFEGAKVALSKANELAPDHPDTLAALAEATAMASGGNLAGEPVALLEQVLAKAPEHPQSRWLLGIARQQAGEHEAAIALFEVLLPEFEGDAPAVASVQQMIDRSAQALSAAEPASDARGTDPVPPNADNSAPAGEANPAGKGAAVTARVSLDLPEGTTVDAGQSVFVYAKAIDGPPMPLAAARLTVGDLPVEITLDESAALMPNLTISSFAEVTIGARISMKDDAIARPGDWLGEVTPVKTTGAGPVQIRIDRKIDP